MLYGIIEVCENGSKSASHELLKIYGKLQSHILIISTTIPPKICVQCLSRMKTMYPINTRRKKSKVHDINRADKSV